MKNHTLVRRLRNHPLFDLLFTLKGNPKVNILIEPLWGIPFNLIAPFATVYMYTLGVTDKQIGLLLSISMTIQLFFSFIGGVITDKLGRKTTTLLGDFFGWTVACLVWAVSQNFWFFLVAMLFNCFEQINQTAWYCLLIEDTDKSQTVHIFTWISIAGLLSVFFAPISGLLIGRFSLVPVMRILYLTFALTMIIKDIITIKYAKETKQGLIRMQETKNTPVHKLLLEYKHIVPLIFKNKATVQTLCITVILHITIMVSGNFFGLYVSETLAIPTRYLAYFPIIRAAIMIIFMFAIQHRIRRIKKPIIFGFTLFITAQLLLIFSPKGQLVTIVACLLLEAVAHALVFPRKDTLVVQNVDPQERARIVALLTTFTILFTSPFGYLSGLLSSMDRRLPFVLSTVLFITAIAVMHKMKEPKLS